MFLGMTSHNLNYFQKLTKNRNDFKHDENLFLKKITYRKNKL